MHSPNQPSPAVPPELSDLAKLMWDAQELTLHPSWPAFLGARVLENEPEFATMTDLATGVLHQMFGDLEFEPCGPLWSFALAFAAEEAESREPDPVTMTWLRALCRDALRAEHEEALVF
jgi:hypothetical protein